MPATENLSWLAFLPCYNLSMNQQKNLRLTCTQCGGLLNPKEGQRFLRCPYCESSVYIDRSKVVFHWYLKSNLDEEAAKSTLKKWMSGKETANDLDKKSLLHEIEFEYCPLWYFRTLRQGQEVIYLQPAAATGTTEVRQLSLPGGDFEPFSNDLIQESQEPTVPLETALNWVRTETPHLQFLEIALIHIPIYTIKYAYQDRIYTALIEASTGHVFANIYPAHKKMPYLLTALLVAAVFTCLSFFPLIGYLIYQEQGALYGGIACLGAGVIMIPILIGVAALVAARN